MTILFYFIYNPKHSTISGWIQIFHIKIPYYITLKLKILKGNIELIKKLRFLHQIYRKLKAKINFYLSFFIFCLCKLYTIKIYYIHIS